MDSWFPDFPRLRRVDRREAAWERGLEVGSGCAWRLGWEADLRLRRLTDPYALHHNRFRSTKWSEGVRARRPSVIDVQHSYVSIPSGFSDVPTILTVHNVLGAPGFSDWSKWQRLAVQRWERRALNSVDHVVVMSENEREALARIYGPLDVPVTVVSIGHPEVGARFREQREVLRSAIFVGAMDYAPNFHAARALLTMWPSLRAQTPIERLVIVGREADRLTSALGPELQGVEIASDVADVRGWLAAADIALMPIEHGGGLRMKALEAMADGLPIVATAKAVEGVGLVDQVSVLHFEDEQSLVQAVLQCESRATREGLADRAQDLWRTRYSVDAMCDAMLAVYEDALRRKLKTRLRP